MQIFLSVLNVVRMMYFFGSLLILSVVLLIHDSTILLVVVSFLNVCVFCMQMPGSVSSLLKGFLEC